MIKLNINRLDQDTINQLKEILPNSHYVDIVVRVNGKTEIFEADWLKELIKHVES